MTDDELVTVRSALLMHAPMTFWSNLRESWMATCECDDVWSSGTEHGAYAQWIDHITTLLTPTAVQQVTK